ncbi:MAG: hypothetical protein ACREX4_07180 [Gammaproteobacteria bacterium]
MTIDSILLIANLILIAILLKPAAEKMGSKLAGLKHKQAGRDEFVPPTRYFDQ